MVKKSIIDVSIYITVFEIVKPELLKKLVLLYRPFLEI